MSQSISDAHRLPAGADRIKMIAGIGGLAAVALAIFMRPGGDWAHFLRAYIFAFMLEP